MNIPVEDWSKQLKEEISKSQKLIAHYEMLCEENKVCNSKIIFFLVFILFVNFSTKIYSC